MKEIGGYFGLDQLVNNEYYKDLIALNNGRNALLYLLKARNIKKLYIPYFLCNSVSTMCTENGYEIEYYNLDKDFLPKINKTLADDEFIYIVNYYGQLTNERIITLKQQLGQIILDNTQAFFQRPINDIDTLYSCRKFFGVPDGAYLSTSVLLNENLKIDVSKERMTHILGRFEGEASDYYNNFQAIDDSFKHENLKKMSKLSCNILGAIDYERVLNKRNENYAFLESHLKMRNKLQLIEPVGAFAYPFFMQNGIEVRKFLANKNIYIPILWPNVLKDVSKDSIEYHYASSILPLPCDQRYGGEDMIHMIKEIEKCLN